MKKNIIITGGHHNSALVVADLFTQRGYSVVWVGHKHASRGDQNESAEYLEVTKRKIPFYDLKAGKSDLRNPLFNFLRAPRGFLQALSILNLYRPRAVISFGSYLGATVALSAALKRIPIFTHEQTIVAGKANRLTSRFAKRIYLTWKESAQHYPRNKTQLVGLPLRDSIIKPRKTKLFPNSNPTILVMGGKQGSHTINTNIFQSLEKLLPKYNLIHQTGTYSVTGDYERALILKESLPPKLSQHYQVHGYITEDEIGHIIKNVDLVISRSGAHTIYELALMGTPAILIPYLHTHQREQLRNARLLNKTGQAEIINQSELTATKLISTIKKKLSSRAKFKLLTIPTDSAEKMVSDIINQLSS